MNEQGKDWTAYMTYSVTSAPTKMTIANNGTWSDAFIFGEDDDRTWSFDNMTFELDVQRNPFDAVPLLSLSSGNGRIVVDDAVQRVLHFNVAPADIQAALDPGVYCYDLVMIDLTTGVRTLLMHGPVTIVQGITYP